MSWLTSVIITIGVVSCSLALGAFQALGQSEDIYLTPTGVAIADEASTMQVNPAAIGFLQAPQIFYAHQRSLYPNRVADAIFAGARLIKNSSLGFSMQWIRPQTQPRFRKTTWTLAISGHSLSLGIDYNRFQSPDPAWEKLSSFDAGLTIHPTSFLSLAATAHNFDSPLLNGQRIPRRYTVGLGLRPDAIFDAVFPRWELSSDYSFDDRQGLRNALLKFSASYQPWDGFKLHGGLKAPVQDGPITAQIALTFNTSHWGVTSFTGATENISQWSQTVSIRVSGDRYPSLANDTASYLVLDISALLSPPTEKFSFFVSQPDPFSQFLARLEQVAQDPDIEGIVLKIGELKDVGHAQIEEIHASLRKVRAQGKRIFALFFGGGDEEYLLASTAERIYAVPQATFLVNGLSISTTYFAQALSQVGVTVDVARVGKYKAFPDTWTRSQMSSPEKEMLETYLQSTFTRYVQTISQARGLSTEKIREILNEGILTAQKAQQAGLVDSVIYPDEVPGKIQQSAQKRISFLADYDGPPDRPLSWKTRPKIVIIPVEGIISEGDSRSDLFGLTQVAGAQTIIQFLEKAVSDKQTAAIVLRVDSGGGSGSASDLMWRAINQAKKYKPIVVSMGNAAASGGYYVSMAAHTIFADPSTVTGSIGVFALKPNFNPLLEKLGINRTTLRQGEHADLFSLTRPWTPSELESVQSYIDEFYGQFITKVAQSRNMNKAKVEEIAQGRIWSGEMAQKIGLVDKLGGLQEAIAYAKIKAGIDGQEIEVERFEEETNLLDILSTNIAAKNSAVNSAVRGLATPLGLSLVEFNDGPLALVPFQITVE